ncbi:MAG: CinA family nicotinamide mononucleotide deamidase-related protein [Desulfobulbaceae bacterium]|jgi:nicotinamide-nucleotide amidase|nr:CinA family nicotinamide mononucleotide deamidase-related protein [Desulfobulbaceae bacterium]
MKIEIIAIGDELTSGRIINTTSSFAARRLFEAGFDIYAIHTIGDTPRLIGEAVRRALTHVDAVIVTGGLGATDDDLTTEAISNALGRPTAVNEEMLAAIRHHLRERSEQGAAGLPIRQTGADHLEKLARLPRGAEALNPWGKMSGYRLVHNGKPIYFLPGIPSQMRRLLIDYVLPGLATWSDGQTSMIRQRLFRIFGLPEIEVNRRIAALALPKTARLGYYPVFPDVHLNLVVRSMDGVEGLPATKQAGDAAFTGAVAMIEETLGEAIYGHNQETLSAVVGRRLLGKKLTLATAESCTGGMIGEWLTSTPGSSAWYLGGVISYANQVKEGALAVSKEMLASHGAVSAEVAEAMAAGVRRLCRADLAISVTGIAGPDGGSDEKPVGTVYIGLADEQGTHAERFLFDGGRRQIREISAQTALNIVRKRLAAP